MKVYYYGKTVDVVFAVAEELTSQALFKEGVRWLTENINCNGLEYVGSDTILKEVKSIDDVPFTWRDDDCLVWGDDVGDMSVRDCLDQNSEEYREYLRLKKKYEKFKK